MKAAHNLVAQVLRHPESAVSLSLAEWDLLIRQARHADLLARIYALLDDQGLIDSIPAKPCAHLESADTVVKRHAQAIRREVLCLRKALATIDLPVILLKGAAYLMADLPPARGRIFSDVDILVPKGQLNQAEAALRLHGWASSHHDAYDQRYYRIWMHELPPMMHLKRQSVLDVHHNILPESARVHPDPVKLIEAAVPVGEDQSVKVLAPVDMVLHSATHLFHEGELEHGLRDLADLNSLLRHFGDSPSFWSTLESRAQELELTRPLFYALHYANLVLGTPIPESVFINQTVSKPSWLLVAIMDALYGRALAPVHPSCSDWLTGTARWLLYVRAHWLRMSPWLLVHHLFHKAFLSQKSS
ncbi:MAG: nucleotidyltransferase family protein [Gammaproteobacteria bacterium]|nr:nucleotidyltransferase family protein [Gammaproteobacteria bacterium]MBU1978237.1 nucleotidyltransferase family protein [Gammaproteobacteria bacterium]